MITIFINMVRMLFFAALFYFVIISGTNATLSISHSNFSSCFSGGTTCTINVTANAADEVVVCAVVGSVGSVGTFPIVSIAGGSLSWSTRFTETGTSTVGSFIGTGWRHTCFATVTSGALVAVAMTVTSNVTIGTALLGYISATGTLASAPFDSNVLATAGGAYANAGTPTTPTLSQTTNQAHDILYMATGTIGDFACGGSHTYGGAMATSQFTVADSHNYGICMTISWLIVSATQSAISDVLTGSGSSLNSWTSIADAMTADVVSYPRGRLFLHNFP